MNHEIRADDNEEVKQDDDDRLRSNEGRDAGDLVSSQSQRVLLPKQSNSVENQQAAKSQRSYERMQD